MRKEGGHAGKGRERGLFTGEKRGGRRTAHAPVGERWVDAVRTHEGGQYSVGGGGLIQEQSAGERGGWRRVERPRGRE